MFCRRVLYENFGVPVREAHVHVASVVSRADKITQRKVEVACVPVGKLAFRMSLEISIGQIVWQRYHEVGILRFAHSLTLLEGFDSLLQNRPRLYDRIGMGDSCRHGHMMQISKEVRSHVEAEVKVHNRSSILTTMSTFQSYHRLRRELSLF